jgi:hypothetical protein
VWAAVGEKNLYYWLSENMPKVLTLKEGPLKVRCWGVSLGPGLLSLKRLKDLIVDIVTNAAREIIS